MITAQAIGAGKDKTESGKRPGVLVKSVELARSNMASNPYRRKVKEMLRCECGDDECQCHRVTLADYGYHLEGATDGYDLRLALLRYDLAALQRMIRERGYDAR